MNDFTLKSSVYDKLKYIALVLLPASAALYFGLGQIWNFPAIEQVVGSVAVVDTFLGVLLRKSSQNYAVPASVGQLVFQQGQDGAVDSIVVRPNADKLILEVGQLVLLEVDREPRDL